MTSVGSRERRILLSMQLLLGPLTHGIVTSLLAVLMLSTSPFEFVIRHFFWLLLVVLSVGAFNSIVVFPIILSIVGPEAELVPLEHTDRISTPSPILTRNNNNNKRNNNKSLPIHAGNSNNIGGGNVRCMNRSSTSSPSLQKPHHYHPKDVNVNNPSLTTITEEPPSWKSSSSSIQMNNEWVAQSSAQHHQHQLQHQQQQHQHQHQQLHHHHLVTSHQGCPVNNCACHHGCVQSPLPPPPLPPPPTHTCGMVGMGNLCSGMRPTPPPASYRSTHLPLGGRLSAKSTKMNTTTFSGVGTGICPTPSMPENGEDASSAQEEEEKNRRNSYPSELQSIVVQPEVTVETHHPDANTTKVTATANIKVELVTPGRAVRSYNFSS